MSSEVSSILFVEHVQVLVTDHHGTRRSRVALSKLHIALHLIVDKIFPVLCTPASHSLLSR